jgi:hypothetical protein
MALSTMRDALLVSWLLLCGQGSSIPSSSNSVRRDIDVITDETYFYGLSEPVYPTRTSSPPSAILASVHH